MRNSNSVRDAMLRLVVLPNTLMLAGVASAQAHHVMGGRVPATFAQGLFSGLGHPIIGIDHLAFLVAMGIVVGVAGLSLVIPLLFIIASALGVALHVSGITLPIAELVVATSVLVAGAAIATGGRPRAWAWLALFSIAGLFHGYAFGESIFGAERTPLIAYLLGLVIVQGALATGVAMLSRRASADNVRPRLAGAVIAGIGIAVLAGQLFPA